MAKPKHMLYNMIYLFESELSETKPICYSLAYIFGIGKKQSYLICKKLGFSKNLTIKNLSKESQSTKIEITSFNDLVDLM